MPRTSLLLALFVLTACGTCLPQGQGVRLRQPTPARLQVTLTYEDGQSRVRDATVELQNSVGSSTAMDQKATDQDGQVVFNTMSGTHRIRITGADIRPYEGEFDIIPGESDHRENIRVRRKAGDQAPTTAREGQNAVPVVRLKIPDNARKEFEKGSKAMEQREWQESRQHFRAAIDLYPDYDLAYNGLGVASSQLNDKPAARQAFVKAVELNDKFAGAQRNLAKIMLSEHNYEQVALLLNQSLNVEPKDAWALTNAAYAELQLKRFKEAAEHALRVHGLPHEGLANAHVIAAHALEALGRQPEAAAQWKLYLTEDPKGPNAKRAQEAVTRLTKSPQS